MDIDSLLFLIHMHFKHLILSKKVLNFYMRYVAIEV